MILALLGLIAFASAAPPVPEGCGGHWNTNPIITTAPRLLSTVPNGKLFLADTVQPPLLVLHVWGSHYEMGVDTLFSVIR